jgi:hypothetical protein
VSINVTTFINNNKKKYWFIYIFRCWINTMTP